LLLFGLELLLVAKALPLAPTTHAIVPATWFCAQR